MLNFNKLFPRLPIRSKLAIAFAVLATAPLLLTGALGTLLTLRYIDQSAMARLNHDLQIAREQTEHFLASAQEDMHFMSASLFRGAFEDGANWAAIDSAVAFFLASKPSFLKLKLFYPDGEPIVIGGQAANSDAERRGGVGGAYYAFRGRSIRPGDSQLLPAEIMGPSGDGTGSIVVPIISIVMPVHDRGGGLLGIAVGEVLASKLFTEIELSSPQLAGITGLVNRDGQFLYHTERKSDWRSLLAAEPDLSLASEFDEQVAGRILWETEGSLRTEDDQLVSFARLRLHEPDAPSLTLYRSVPVAIINRPVRQFLWAVGTVGLLVLATALVLAVVAATQFTRPIYKLREGTRRLAEGDFNQHLEVETNDELEELASDFALMAERLRAHTQGLEELVEARSAALRQAHTELAEILANSADAIIRLDPNGRIRVWNRGAEKLFGYAATEVEGQSAAKLLLPPGRDRRSEIAAIARELRRSGSVLDHHTKCIRKDGELVDVSLSQTVIRDGVRGTLGFTLIIRDVTRHKAFEKQMLRSERLAAAGRLAAGIAHEINNPIGIVLNRLECVELDLAEQWPEAGVQADLTVIKEQTERVGEVARRLLSLSRDEPEVREALDINEVVGRVIRFLERTFERKSLIVETVLSASLPLVQASSNGLEIMILNLLLNAVDASADRGSIVISTGLSIDGRHVRLDVSDTGSGIDEKLLERIFEPFFTTKEGPRGTGLGLAVTRNVVQAHGGNVSVQSEVGRGSRFTIELPVQPEKEQWKTAVS